MTPRQTIIAALADLPDADLVLVARLVAMLPLASLRARLASVSDPETSKHHPLTPTPWGLWTQALALQALDAIGRQGR